MAWVLTRGLQTVRAEFNTAFADRDKTTDGSVGDLSHQTGSSGHNPDLTGRAEYKDGDDKDEVRAIDVDKDLVPGSDVDWMERVVQYVVTRARSGIYVPFRYIIYKRRIWHVNNGWQSATYTGSNTHTEHAHFSGGWSQTADEWTGSLGLASLRDTGEGEAMIPCKKGDSGQHVTFWQYVLNRLEGAGLAYDGEYGPVMETAVNAYRKKWADAGPNAQITGWMAYHVLVVRLGGQQGPAGKDGAPGAPGKNGLNGAPGLPGKDGTLTGVLEIEGGVLNVRAPQ